MEPSAAAEEEDLAVVGHRRGGVLDMFARGETVLCDGQELWDGNAHQYSLDVVAAEQGVIVRDVIVHRETSEGGELLGGRARAIGEGGHDKAIRHADHGWPVELFHGEAGADDPEPNQALRGGKGLGHEGTSSSRYRDLWRFATGGGQSAVVVVMLFRPILECRCYSSFGGNLGENLKIVVDLNHCPGFRTVVGKLG